MLTVHPDFDIKDVKSFSLRLASWKNYDVDAYLESPKFKVSGSGGLKWWIRVYPAGCTDADKGYVGVFIYVNKPVMSKCKCISNHPSIQKSFTYSYDDTSRGYGWADYVSHKSFGSISGKRKAKKFTITCILEFDIDKQHDASVPRVYQLFRHESPDFELVVDSNRVPAHKNFLSLISPVFKAMLSSDIAESKPNEVKITDFSFDTVKAAIDFCYGRELEDLSLGTAVNILRFCHKYSITAAIEEIEKLSLFDLTTDSFCKIVRYAYDCRKIKLLDKCCEFFKGHQDGIKAKAEFVDFPLILVVDVLKKAFTLKTLFDVLDHALQNGIGFIVNDLEDFIGAIITFDTFCLAVRYAWKWSRDRFKKVCAKYLINNREQVTDSQDFLNLPAEVVLSILKVAHEGKRRIA
uniref:BTB domain-containing protein n=2 Tax=Panagrellus redivivus TaxID=6233 RepID=A0A7E4UQC3_PANRE